MSVSLDTSIKQPSVSIEESFLPNTVLLILERIFENLDIPDLANSCLVCKRWNQVINTPVAWKKVIYEKLAFSNKKWAESFGEEVIENEDMNAEFASLPLNIVDEYRKFYRLYPKKEFEVDLMLVRFPKTLNGGLTPNSFGNLTKKYFPENEDGYGLIIPAVANALGDKSIEESVWVLMTTDALPGSKNRIYAIQKQMVVNLAAETRAYYQIPTTLEAAVCILAQYFASRKRLFSNKPITYTRCQESINYEHVLVGDFGPEGLLIRLCGYYHGHKSVGVAAVLKFKDNLV